MRSKRVARASCKGGLATPRAGALVRALGSRGAEDDSTPGPEPAARV
jgi:hypothetical protein